MYKQKYDPHLDREQGTGRRILCGECSSNEKWFKWEGWDYGYPFHNRSSCPWESEARGEGEAVGRATLFIAGLIAKPEGCAAGK